MATPCEGGRRRRRLIAGALGRSLDEVYRHPEFRADLEAEAASGDPEALMTPEMLDDLRDLVAEKRARAWRAEQDATRSRLFFSTETVVLVPGFLASALSDSAKRGLGLIWVDPKLVLSDQIGALQLKSYDGTETDLDPRVKIEATGALPIFYDLLRLALEVRRYTTEVFAVDWRKDLDLAAKRLAARLKVLAEQKRPIHLIAHSQGALVARRALQRLGAAEARRIVRRLVLIGPANYGSFSAAFALAGSHTLIPLARRLAIEPVQGFQRVLASMTGLYQLLPWDRDRVPWLREVEPGRPDFWKVEIDADRLTRFFGWGTRIDSRFFDDRTTILLGDNHGTPTAGGAIFEGTWLRDDPDFSQPGDGTVLHSCSVLPGVPTYLAANTEHSMLATNRRVISAVVDALAGRSVTLPLVSSDPADHLGPAREGLVTRGRKENPNCLVGNDLLPPPLRGRAGVGGPIDEIDFASPCPDSADPRFRSSDPPSQPSPARGEGATRLPSNDFGKNSLRKPSGGEDRVGGASARNQGGEQSKTLESAPAGGSIPLLNGRFLTSYDSHRAEPEELGPALGHRRDQLRDHQERLELQLAKEAETSSSSYELILEASNLLPFDFLRTGDRLGRAVVKIERGDGAAGTAFLVAPGILLTNHHVLPDVATAAGSKALANYEIAPPADPASRLAIVPLDPAGLFLTNPDLDFTFCGVAGLDHLGSVPLDRNSLNILRSEHVNIIQHPRGRPKEIALQDNRVIRADNVVLHYSCDTEPGSSGSPVFNNQWKLVALHHASVVSDDGRPSPAGAPGARYLNEGIRLSAIAAWLETSEANTPELRPHAQRLRAIFQGLDPQVGFFGALGRKGRGRSAAEVVVETYRAGTDALDVGFWNLAGVGPLVHDRLAQIGRVIAEMNVDLWCLTHTTPAGARALCDHLDTTYQLDYHVALASPDGRPGLAILARWDRTLSVSPLSRPHLQATSSAGVTVRVATSHGTSAVFQLVAFPPDCADSPAQARALVADLAQRSDEAADWIVVGDPRALPSPDALAPLAQVGCEPLSLVSDPDGALLLLSGPRSPVEQVFASPNLSPDLESADRLTIARDRSLPELAASIPSPRPVAVRLILGPEPSPRSVSPVESLPPPPPAPDSTLEQRLRDLLTPFIAQIVAEVRCLSH